MAEIIDGKFVAGEIKKEIRKITDGLEAEGKRRPCLAVIIVGENPASKVYVRNKRLACEAAGIKSLLYELPEETTETELLGLIDGLNADSSVDGILTQLPLPKGISEKNVTEHIIPEKDVDCFNPVNVGRLHIGGGIVKPCTPAGIIELLKRYNVEIAGKKCVVCGRSNIVGKPMAALLLAESGTVTITHSKTADLKAETKQADILVAAIGKAKFFNADYVKPGAVVIDVGMDRDENGKLCGDVDYESVAPLASKITPVPGGVGPMTVAMLLKNTLSAYNAEASDAEKCNR